MPNTPLSPKSRRITSNLCPAFISILADFLKESSVLANALHSMPFNAENVFLRPTFDDLRSFKSIVLLIVLLKTIIGLNAFCTLNMSGTVCNDFTSKETFCREFSSDFGVGSCSVEPVGPRLPLLFGFGFV